MNRISKYVVVALAAVVAAALPLASQATDSFTITTPFVSNALSSCGDLQITDGVIDSQGFSSGVVGKSGNVISNGSIKVVGFGTVNGNATAGPGQTATTSGK